MGTEMLRPQDCLIERLRVGPVVFPRRRSFAGFNHRTNRKPHIRSEHKKRVLHPETSSSNGLKSDRNVVTGQLTTVKQGELLASEKKSQFLKNDGEDMLVYGTGTGRLGQDPEMVPKLVRKLFSPPAIVVRSDVYAGSAFCLSPSPRSLPLPSFSRKNDGLAIVDDSATKGLRRLLRLD